MGFMYGNRLKKVNIRSLSLLLITGIKLETYFKSTEKNSCGHMVACCPNQQERFNSDCPNGAMQKY